VFQGIIARHRSIEFLPHPGTKQVAQLRQVEVAVQATPTANLVLVQPQLFFGLAKTTLDGPALKGNAQQPPEREPSLPWHPVRHKVFHLLGQNVAGDD
jgi:hypothetical protein